MFRVIKRLDNFTIKGYTLHALRDRAERLELLSKDKGACIGIYLVDKGHAHGLEVHILYNTARVLVCNESSGLICTGIFLAPCHLPRYGATAHDLLQWAEYNEREGLNFL